CHKIYRSLVALPSRQRTVWRRVCRDARGFFEVHQVVFDSLSEKLQAVFRALRGHGSLTESDVDAALREIRLALLEADVHFKVVKQFLERVRSRATGQEVLKSLTPAQAVIRVVRDEMVELLGGTDAKRLETSARLPSVVLMTGLQGSGKTTS